MTVHRIRLRGPWQLQPVAAEGSPPRKLRLPARRDELLRWGAGRVRLSRVFHRPTNLSPPDRISLVVADLPAGAQVLLNGASLGPEAGTAADSAVFAAPALAPDNLLTIELDVAGIPVVGDQTWGDIALVIDAS